MNKSIKLISIVDSIDKGIYKKVYNGFNSAYQAVSKDKSAIRLVDGIIRNRAVTELIKFL